MIVLWAERFGVRIPVRKQISFFSINAFPHMFNLVFGETGN
jgi:hypothetical protein